MHRKTSPFLYWVVIALLLVLLCVEARGDDRYGYPRQRPWVRYSQPSFAIAPLGEGRILWFGPHYDYYDPRFTADHEHGYHTPRPYVVPRAYQTCRTQGSFVVDWRKQCDR